MEPLAVAWISSCRKGRGGRVGSRLLHTEIPVTPSRRRCRSSHALPDCRSPLPAGASDRKLALHARHARRLRGREEPDAANGSDGRNAGASCAAVTRTWHVPPDTPVSPQLPGHVAKAVAGLAADDNAVCAKVAEIAAQLAPGRQHRDLDVVDDGKRKAGSLAFSQTLQLAFAAPSSNRDSSDSFSCPALSTGCRRVRETRD